MSCFENLHGEISDLQKDSPFIHITSIKRLCWYYTPQEVSEQFVQLLFG